MFMKKVWLVLALIVGLSPMLNAGAIKQAPFGKGGGNSLLDGTDGQGITEVYERGIKWGVPVQFGCPSNSALVVPLTGASSTYKGPYYMMLDVTALASVAVQPSASTTPITTASGVIVKTLESGIIGPISRSNSTAHLIGLTTTTGGSYSIGFKE